MEKLVQAIVAEVCVNYGIKPGTPMPKAMQVNIEGRIKAYLSVTLGVGKPADVLESMRDRLTIAQADDQRRGLTGPWYQGENAKRLGA